METILIHSNSVGTFEVNQDRLMDQQLPSDVRVSVVIPSYNAGKYVGRAIYSVLSQTYFADEIIVVDDGSTDDTAEMIQRFGSQIRYIRQANAGAGAARNHGIREAKNTWIAFLDADDEWLPTKLEQQISVIRRNDELVWMGSNYYRYSPITGRRHPLSDIGESLNLMAGRDYFKDYFDASRHSNGGWTGTMLIRREILQHAGLFDENLEHGEEDTDLWWRIAYRWPKYGYVAEPLAVYYIEIESSLMSRHIPVSVPTNLICRHLRLSAEYNRLEAFRPVGEQLLRVHIRSMLFEQRKKDIHFLLKEFSSLLPFYYRCLMRLLTLFPGITAEICFGISRFIRFFNLRRQVVPHPIRNRKQSINTDC